MSALFKYLTLCGLLLISFVLSLRFGAVTLEWTQLLTGLSNHGNHAFTIYEYRLPRALLAVIAGAMLSVSGVLIQGVIRNPLASPDILGISHGAGLSAVVFMIFFPGLNVSYIPWVAMCGGLSAAIILAFIVRGDLAPVTLAVTGVALSALFAGVIDFILLIHPFEINNALLWLTGSLWGRGWEQLALLLPWAIFLPVAFIFSHPLNLLVLGEQRATTLGIPVYMIKVAVLLLAVCWTSSVVSVCGPVSFLGLVAPHLARRLFGGRHQLIIPGSMCIGALLLIFADFCARTIAPPIELPAGILTALIGAPYFLYLLMKMR
ncbi:Fe(3+) dicitrate ABC transporter permease subunit FecD [Vibrio quintilis]|uniref:Fe(3+) dicitrate transport system permease protein FecD n=1 Tax=Vibrio quintilis TaxID=1117707 RepID=A0A1M7YPJ6_9VIBR|nr:Fe(3+) dicitrate ABC transporter permease subunit FecD [Vibrio quintilis]SHO54534.1 Fe(3+) dicitrate transport system permease protein FecD [Vibrio quintilis]